MGRDEEEMRTGERFVLQLSGWTWQHHDRPYLSRGSQELVSRQAVQLGPIQMVRQPGEGKQSSMRSGGSTLPSWAPVHHCQFVFLRGPISHPSEHSRHSSCIHYSS